MASIIFFFERGESIDVRKVANACSKTDIVSNVYHLQVENFEHKVACCFVAASFDSNYTPCTKRNPTKQNAGGHKKKKYLIFYSRAYFRNTKLRMTGERRPCSTPTIIL